MPAAAPEPAAARWKAFASSAGNHVLVVEGSRVFDLPDGFRAALDAGDEAAAAALETALARAPGGALDQPAAFAPQNISLNVSSSCNLGCGYCYAGRGGFAGAQHGPMSWQTARAAIDRLLATSLRSAPAVIGYIGGEPFVNRPLIHRATSYAAARGRALRQDVRFSVTTNGTLLRAEDRALMRQHPFAVTISLDGGREIHERQRPGSDFGRLERATAPLVARPGLAKVCARATVTRENFDLVGRFDAIRALGFEDIGFSPVRVGPGALALGGKDWARCLEAYVRLGQRELRHLAGGRHTAFSNLVVALKQIHRGACAPYPCGAAGGYFSVGTDGRWYACHRAIGDARFLMGDSAGLDEARRAAFLARRHVHAQTDCRTCWARYLCSGACHQEASARSPESCDFIRGWLEFCLEAYAGLGPAGRDRLCQGDRDGRQVQAFAQERDGLACGTGGRQHRDHPA
jgi:uncharacterized protein